CRQSMPNQWWASRWVLPALGQSAASRLFPWRETESGRRSRQPSFAGHLADLQIQGFSFTPLERDARRDRRGRLEKRGVGPRIVQRPIDSDGEVVAFRQTSQEEGSATISGLRFDE